MNTGKLDRYINVLQRGDYTNPDTGERKPAWLFHKRLAAEKLSRSVAERVLGVELASLTAVTFKIRFNRWITPRMRIDYEGQTYRINGIHEGYGRLRELFLSCVTEEPERDVA